MSQYEPKADFLKAVKHENWKGTTGTVWMIHDAFGEYDGPYATETDALHVINNITGGPSGWEYLSGGKQ